MSEEKVVKRGKKVIIGDNSYPIQEDMSIDELLTIIRENPAYTEAERENLFQDEDGNFEVLPLKSNTLGC